MFFYELNVGLASAVYLALLVLKMWALVDAIMRPTQGYLAADKLTKAGWLWILGLGLIAHIILPILMLNLIGVVAALVYLLDVKPAIAELTRRR